MLPGFSVGHFQHVVGFYLPAFAAVVLGLAFGCYVYCLYAAPEVLMVSGACRACLIPEMFPGWVLACLAREDCWVFSGLPFSCCVHLAPEDCWMLPGLAFARFVHLAPENSWVFLALALVFAPRSYLPPEELFPRLSFACRV